MSENRESDHEQQHPSRTAEQGEKVENPESRFADILEEAYALAKAWPRSKQHPRPKFYVLADAATGLADFFIRNGSDEPNTVRSLTTGQTTLTHSLAERSHMEVLTVGKVLGALTLHMPDTSYFPDMANKYKDWLQDESGGKVTTLETRESGTTALAEGLLRRSEQHADQATFLDQTVTHLVAAVQESDESTLSLEKFAAKIMHSAARGAEGDFDADSATEMTLALSRAGALPVPLLEAAVARSDYPLSAHFVDILHRTIAGDDLSIKDLEAIRGRGTRLAQQYMIRVLRSYREAGSERNTKNVGLLIKNLSNSRHEVSATKTLQFAARVEEHHTGNRVAFTLPGSAFLSLLRLTRGADEETAAAQTELDFMHAEIINMLCSADMESRLTEHTTPADLGVFVPEGTEVPEIDESVYEDEERPDRPQHKSMTTWVRKRQRAARVARGGSSRHSMRKKGHGKLS